MPSYGIVVSLMRKEAEHGGSCRCAACPSVFRLTVVAVTESLRVALRDFS